MRFGVCYFKVKEIKLTDSYMLIFFAGKNKQKICKINLYNLPFLILQECFQFICVFECARETSNKVSVFIVRMSFGT